MGLPQIFALAFEHRSKRTEARISGPRMVLTD
jgi:hypothetical protein